MIGLERTRELNASPDTVKAEPSRDMHIDDLAPMVTSVKALTSAQGGLGARRRCHFENGGAIVEKVTEWEPGRGYEVRSSELDPMPLHELVAGIAVAPKGADVSTVTWSVGLRVKCGPLGWLLGQVMMKRMMGKVLDGKLQGLAAKVEGRWATDHAIECGQSP